MAPPLVVVEPNTGSTALAVDQLTIANHVDSVTQEHCRDQFRLSRPVHCPHRSERSGRGDHQLGKSRPRAATGPVQSCSGSAGYKTAWWMVTAPSSGYLQARAYGRRYIVFGNSGIVITAYPQIALRPTNWHARKSRGIPTTRSTR